VNRSSPGPSSFRSANRPQGIRRAPFGGGSGPHPTVAASDHALLRGRIEPQVDTRLTALAELRRARSHAGFPRSGSLRDAALIGRRHLTAALSTTCEVEELPLTSLSRLARAPASDRSHLAWRRGPVPRRARQGPALPRSEDVFHRRMPLEGPSGCPEESPTLLVCRIEGPATGLSASPPRSGFRRLFASRALSRCGARPTFVPTALRRRRRCGPDVVRRLLQSRRFASTTTVRSNPAPPRARSPVRVASPGPRPPLSRRARSRDAGGDASCPTSRSRAPP